MMHMHLCAFQNQQQVFRGLAVIRGFGGGRGAAVGANRPLVACRMPQVNIPAHAPSGQLGPCPPPSQEIHVFNLLFEDGRCHLAKPHIQLLGQ